jgi:DNA-binding MarR family transcriptional regulator
MKLQMTQTSDNTNLPSYPRFTEKQGQYLAFIHAYTSIHRRPPSEADLQRYFHVSPPSVHQMILSLHRAGLIERQTGASRTIRLLLDPQSLPVLR